MALLTLFEIPVDKQPTICDSNDLADCPLVEKQRRVEIHKYFDTLKRIIRKLFGNSIVLRIETIFHNDGSISLGLVLDDGDEELGFSRDELKKKVKLIYDKINEAVVNSEKKNDLEQKIVKEEDSRKSKELQIELEKLNESKTLNSNDVYLLESLPKALEVESPVNLGGLSSKKMQKTVEKKQQKDLEIEVNVLKMDTNSVAVFFTNDDRKQQTFNIPYVVGRSDYTYIFQFALTAKKPLRVKIFDVKAFEYRSPNTVLDSVLVTFLFDVSEVKDSFNKAMASVSNLEIEI